MAFTDHRQPQLNEKKYLENIFFNGKMKQKLLKFGTGNSTKLPVSWSYLLLFQLVLVTSHISPNKNILVIRILQTNSNTKIRMDFSRRALSPGKVTQGRVGLVRK